MHVKKTYGVLSVILFFFKYRYKPTHTLRYIQSCIHKCVNIDMAIITGSKAGFDPSGYHTW